MSFPASSIERYELISPVKGLAGPSILRKKKNILISLCAINLVILFLVFHVFSFTSSMEANPIARSGNTDECPILLQPNLNYDIVTALYNNRRGSAYFRYLNVLSYTLQVHHPTIPKHLIYLRDQPLADQHLCFIRNLGWEPTPVSYLPHPQGDRANEFKDQFNKLHIWNMTQYDVVLYVDVDTYFLRPVHEIFPLGRYFCLAAVPDNSMGKDSFEINAGVLLVRPNASVFDKLLVGYMEERKKYDLTMAEQSFLNYYYRHEILYLPETYNLNSAKFLGDKSEFFRLQAKAHIHHLTIAKPNTHTFLHPPNNKLDKRVWSVNYVWFETEHEMVGSMWWKGVKRNAAQECGNLDGDLMVTEIEEWSLDGPWNETKQGVQQIAD